jgi:phosphatidylserine/phosphatidylglycerophosphate/cardiolipin synthase-like enzyme
MAGQDAPDLARLAVRLAQAVPETVVLGVAAALDTQGTPVSASARAWIVADVAQPVYRAAVARFLDGWAASHPAVPPVAVAYALRTAARAATIHRAETSTELVWTGPNPDATPLRRTDQALLEVIDTARHTLTIVTFAAYHVPAIAAALVRAAARSVRMRIIVESAQVSEGKLAYEAIDALGSQVASMATVYVWPLDRRPVDDKGKHGSLHVKCAIADDDVLFVSSANLTAYALTLNMELGLLVRGGRIPPQVAAHIDALIRRGVVVPLGA